MSFMLILLRVIILLIMLPLLIVANNNNNNNDTIGRAACGASPAERVGEAGRGQGLQRGRGKCYHYC